jgi:osmotically-inducible protein OsmY
MTPTGDDELVDDDLALDILEELLVDPTVGLSELAVRVQRGHVTLDGMTATDEGKRRATADAYRLLGVTSVTNNLIVDPGALGMRPDRDLEQEVRSALRRDGAGPDTRISVTVKSGIVTLLGDVDWLSQRARVEEAARRVQGVLGIDNRLTALQPAALAKDVAEAITQAGAHTAEPTHDLVLVSATDDGRVTLSGTVSTRSERDRAVEAAVRVPGVTAVADNIVLELLSTTTA